MPKPLLGEIVLYHDDDDRDWPAMVVMLVDDYHVHLCVFMPAPTVLVAVYYSEEPCADTWRFQPAQPPRFTF